MQQLVSEVAKAFASAYCEDSHVVHVCSWWSVSV